MTLPLDARPVVVAIAGPNGAGKSTFFETFIRPAGLRFLNADLLASNLQMEPYAAAHLADELRQHLVTQRESFAFETVFSDPVGSKLAFLNDAADRGYNVVLCFMGISSPDISEERVAMRVVQGGHNVPTSKLRTRFPRTLRNLRLAIPALPHVWIYDNSDLRTPFRLTAVAENGHVVRLAKPVPGWLKPLLPKGAIEDPR